MRKKSSAQINREATQKINELAASMGDNATQNPWRKKSFVIPATKKR